MGLTEKVLLNLKLFKKGKEKSNLLSDGLIAKMAHSFLVESDIPPRKEAWGNPDSQGSAGLLLFLSPQELLFLSRGRARVEL